MALSNIQVDTAAYWKQQCEIAQQQLESERKGRLLAEKQVCEMMALKDEVKKATSDVNTLQCKLEDQRKCTSMELDTLHDGGTGTNLEKRAKQACKLSLHCKVQRLQLWKWQLSTACEAELNHLIWMCNSAEAAANIDALAHEIKVDLELCTDLPFNLQKHYQTVLVGC